ncbi:MAG: tetratricopeptide repeat protein [Thiomargarita sp.]|nr:tetratricopeptide repeat protein [Thiomargarita sp.]
MLKSNESAPNISTLVTPLSKFLERFVSEESIPFTWLIGAGMSVTSGIPLSKDISYRIILFEYIMHEKRVRPWASDNKECITYEMDLTEFLKWYETIDNKKEASFVDLRYNAIMWFTKKDKYKNISLEDPKCYQWLFQNVFSSPTIQHVFLKNLINRSKGVNLAHLGLAGLLKDHQKWGHTVFTTNFDDLLLKALLSLNHTARVFGDIQSNERPHISPDYPQIVHLQGRHTHRLQEHSALIDPVLADGFMTQIAHSHLIVIGYSGCDDFVINALKEWPNQHDLIKGNLIWIPHQNEHSLLPQVQAFLNSCPPNRVHVITNKEHTLDADSFMLSLCDVLNKDNGGFVPYRKGIIDHAKLQHDFIFQQLEYHPDFDPKQALYSITLAREKLEHADVQKAGLLKISAMKLVESDDIPNELRGKVFLEIGIIELLLGNSNNSELYLLKALSIWGTVKEYYDKYQIEKAHTLRALGELYLTLGNLEEAKGYLIGSFRRYSKISENIGIGYSKKLLSDISMREGKMNKATTLLTESLNAFNMANDIYGQAICFRSQGDMCRINDNQDLAIENYDNAHTLFKKINNWHGIANTLKGKADIYIRSSDYTKAEETINEAIVLYQDLKDRLGIANMENSLGDLYFQRGDIKTATKQYQKSANGYREVGAKHGLSNALADILVCFSKDSDNDVQEIHKELFEVSKLCHNAYALNIAEQFQNVENIHSDVTEFEGVSQV